MSVSHRLRRQAFAPGREFQGAQPAVRVCRASANSRCHFCQTWCCPALERWSSMENGQWCAAVRHRPRIRRRRGPALHAYESFLRRVCLEVSMSHPTTTVYRTGMTVRAATAARHAPSILNTQPWRWRLQPERMELVRRTLRSTHRGRPAGDGCWRWAAAPPCITPGSCWPPRAGRCTSR